MSKKKIVITGGPGTGKTSIINDLKNRGYTCLDEISRQITLDAREKGIEQLFLTEPLLFSELLIKGRKQQFVEAQMAIEEAEKGNYNLTYELYELLKNPYYDQPENEKWFSKRPEWAKEKVGCSMLSCSS